MREGTVGDGQRSHIGDGAATSIWIRYTVVGEGTICDCQRPKVVNAAPIEGMIAGEGTIGNRQCPCFFVGNAAVATGEDNTVRDRQPSTVVNSTAAVAGEETVDHRQGSLIGNAGAKITVGNGQTVEVERGTRRHQHHLTSVIAVDSDAGRGRAGNG